MIQFRSMEYAIRLRGIRENPREDIRTICAEALATLLKLDDPDEVFFKIDKIYRVNSRAALQRQLPRDVVIYFNDRYLRNDILQKSFYSALQIDGIQIGVFKELPPAMFKSRRDFGFLVAELKQRQTQYRWDAPMGVILRYDGVRYRLNTLDKAREFYFEILKASTTPPHTSTPTGALEDKKQWVETNQGEKQLRTKEKFPDS